MRASGGRTAAALAVTALATVFSSALRAQDMPTLQVPAVDAGGSEVSEGQELLLAVTVNEQSTGLLSTFRLLPDGHLAAEPADLETLSIDPAGGTVSPDGLVPLDSLPLSYSYDAAQQAVFVTVTDAGRRAHEVDVSRATPLDTSRITSGFGFVLNYGLIGTAEHDFDLGGTAFALDGTAEARLGTGWGVLTSSAVGGLSTGGRDPRLVRLDSVWRTVDADDAIVYRAGDAVSGALSWTSAWRLGGVQVARDFGVRPDLVTTSSPDLGGTAAVPSTLDLYVDNIRIFSGEVPAGPFDFVGLPQIGAGGQARVVLKDATGQQVVTERPYYYTPGLLRDGLFSFSAEAGFPRRAYGTDSFDYAPDLAASASLRWGATPWLTAETHAEGTRGLANGGFGFIMGLGPFGRISGSASASRFDDATGAKLTADYQVSWRGVSLYAGTERTLGDWQTVASVAAGRESGTAPISTTANAIDRLSLTLPLLFDPSAISVAYTRVDASDDRDSELVTVSWSRTLFGDVSLYFTGYEDLAQPDNYGAFAGLSIPLGDQVSAGADVATTVGDTSFGATLGQPLGRAQGDWGWTLRARETLGGDPQRFAGVDYRSAVGTLGATVAQSGDIGRATLSVDGAVVVAGGGVFLADRIEDAFAVVSGAGPGTAILLDTVPIATADSGGRALVTDLDAFRDNVLTLDPTNLPLDQQPTSTEATVVPGDRAGVVVDFGVQHIDGAVVVLTGADGAMLPVGARVTLDATGETTVVGYDGRAWITGLAAGNTVTVALPEAKGTCSAAFDYAPREGGQVEIGPVACR